MVGHYVINCNNKQNGKTRVCKNYYSKKHQTNRKKWYATHGKYQKKTNVKRKKKKSIVVVPQTAVAKNKKRIAPTLISGAGLQQPQVFGSATGQQTFQMTNGVDTAAEFGFVSKPHKKTMVQVNCAITQKRVWWWQKTLQKNIKKNMNDIQTVWVIILISN